MKVLDVDTITQVKEKVLDAVFLNKPQSERKIAAEVDLGKYMMIIITWTFKRLYVTFIMQSRSNLASSYVGHIRMPVASPKAFLTA